MHFVEFSVSAANLAAMAAKSREARAVLRELDKDLSAHAASMGVTLQWTAADKVVLGLLAESVDRKVELREMYDAADDVKAKVKLSTEIRLIDAQIGRFLKQVRTGLPQPMSRRSQRAQAAANARWNREAG